MTTETKTMKHSLSDIFVCARCGYCCQGETTVSLDEDDQRRMVEELDIDVDSVRDKYWRVTDNIVQMKIVDGHCIFYDENTGCTVHKGRPWRCSEWPLHPSIITDKNNFETIRESCPGINKDLSYDEFCVILQQLTEQAVRIKC